MMMSPPCGGCLASVGQLAIRSPWRGQDRTGRGESLQPISMKHLDSLSQFDTIVSPIPFVGLQFTYIFIRGVCTAVC